MNTQVTEVEAHKDLKFLERKITATRAFRTASAPRGLIVLIVIVSVLLKLYTPQNVIAPEYTGYFVAVIFATVALLILELWSVRCRLRAAIELLDLGQSEI